MVSDICGLVISFKLWYITGMKYANLFTRRGALGDKALLHLSKIYETRREAEHYSDVIPDAGWEFVTTLEIRNTLSEQRQDAIYALFTDRDKRWPVCICGEIAQQHPLNNRDKCRQYRPSKPLTPLQQALTDERGQ